jgi:predicted glutamine amidotransferase
MCELLAISARFPTTIRLSLDELARHGGGTGPHRDGWGVAFVHDGDAMVLREPEAAHESRLLACAQHHTSRTCTAMAHIRKATQGAAPAAQHAAVRA